MNKKERLEAIIKHYSDGKPSVFGKVNRGCSLNYKPVAVADTLDYDLLFLQNAKTYHQNGF